MDFKGSACNGVQGQSPWPSLASTDYPQWPNLAAMLFGCAQLWPDRTAFRHHRNGAWQDLTWRNFADQAASLARALRTGGVAAGDRVLVASPSRPEVAIAELALMAIRAVPVPAYTTNTVADHAHLLRDAAIRVAIVGTPQLAATLAAAGPLDRLLLMDGPEWTAATGDRLGVGLIAAEATDIKPGAMACLIYTSGTSGTPRGVMQPHRAILANCRSLWQVVRRLNLTGERYLSVLPLSHGFEHTVGLFFFPSLGIEIVFARGVEHLAADLVDIAPGIVIVVPRILEVIRSRILAQVGRSGRLSRTLFEAALAAGLRRLDGHPRRLDRLADPLLDRLVRARIRTRFGGRLRAAVCGGARLDPTVGRFFTALGVKVMQGYGQTEAGPVISVNPFDTPRADTVGPPLQGVELRIAEDGEVLVRGDLVMDGYWRQPEATAATIVDGWLHTGDVGVIEPDSHLRITDRKRDIIVLAGGETISPAKVEHVLMAQPGIAQAVVAGDGRQGLVALVVAEDGDAAAAAAGIAAANRALASTERIRHHAVVDSFTLANALLTPTQKIRRTLVLATHANQISRLKERPGADGG